MSQMARKGDGAAIPFQPRPTFDLEVDNILFQVLILFACGIKVEYKLLSDEQVSAPPAVMKSIM